MLSARDIYPEGTSTMDTHRTLEKERKDKPILLETVLQSRSLSQLSNGDRTSDCIVIEGCGQIDTTLNTTQRTTIVGMTSSRRVSEKQSSSCCLA